MANEISGRNADDPIHQIGDAQAKFREGWSIRIPFEDGFGGTLVASLHRSKDNEDRGGIVISITIEHDGQQLVPTAQNIKNGIELHLGADYGAQVFLSAIAALQADNDKFHNL